MIDPWPWSQPVYTAGDAVLALRTRLWPEISSRHVYTLVNSGHLTVPTMPSSLVTEAIAFHLGARRAAPAPERAGLARSPSAGSSRRLRSRAAQRAVDHRHQLARADDDDDLVEHLISRATAPDPRSRPQPAR